MLAAALAGFAGPASASLTPDQLASVGVRPPPDATLPLDAPLTDIDGHSTTLAAAIAGRPAVVIFADYDCQQLCSPIVALAGSALKDSGLTPGAALASRSSDSIRTRQPRTPGGWSTGRSA